MDRRAFTITRLRRDEEGVWRAWVSCNGGGAVEVDRRYGSWRALVRDGPGRRSFHVENVTAAVAAALQAKVRPHDKPAKVARAQ